MGALAKRLTAQVGFWRARRFEGQQYFSLRRLAAHRMVAVVGAENRVIGRHAEPVGALDYALATGAQKIAVRVEDDDRMRA